MSCVSCVKGKLSRVTMKPRTQKATSRGDVIFTDVCGPLPVESLSGKRYLITFTDSFSSFKDVSLMRGKSEALRCFKEFQARFERSNNCKIQLVYSDNGEEYRGLVEYLCEQGIEWEIAAPYTPQQNGVAERLNRTVMESSRSMLQQPGLPDTFRVEAVSTAVSLHNITSTTSNTGKTPMEVLTGKVPLVGNLRCFGSEVWIFYSKRKRLDPKSRRGILIRSLPHRNYRVWDIKFQ